MRELTLRHLLLLVGKAIAENEIDSEESLRINSISKTLHISREKRSPYVINWEINGSKKSLLVEDSRFKFHVRGDVPNRNPQNEDMRSSNWAEACAVWSTILDKEVRTDSNQLAPQFFAELSQARRIRVLQLVFSLIAVATAVLWDQKTGFVLFGVLAINECLKLGDVYTRRRISLLMTASLSVVLVACVPNVAPALIALLILEMITAILVLTYKETSIIAIGLLACLLLTFINEETSLRGQPVAVAGFLSFSFLAVATLPLGKSGNLRRISVMFSIAMLFLCLEIDIQALWVAALFGVFGVFPIGSRKSKVTVMRDLSPVTPVSIRQSRGL